MESCSAVCAFERRVLRSWSLGWRWRIETRGMRCGAWVSRWEREAS
jgi:hypothetical protein